MKEYVELGKRIYNLQNKREVRRMWVFVARCFRHHRDIKKLLGWFHENGVRERILAERAFPVEQVTRAFFYNQSTFQERMELVKNHFALVEKIFKTEYQYDILTSYHHGIALWTARDEGEKWYCELAFSDGQRKEGMCSLDMHLGEHSLYQMIFWLGYDRQGEEALFIGAMQGPNMENARDVVKAVTKRSHAYRTKNLILYMTRAFARAAGIKHIYAVSNHGYYANNHVRADRKLKTDFGAFWQEAGGWQTEDDRWFELPLTEARKTMEEVPTRKRAVYRRRFAFLDEVDEEITQSVNKLLW